MIHILGPRASGKTVEAIWQSVTANVVWNGRLNNDKSNQVLTVLVTDSVEGARMQLQSLLQPDEKGFYRVLLKDYKHFIKEADRYRGLNYPIFIDNIESFAYELAQFVRSYPSSSSRVIQALAENMVGYTTNNTNGFQDFLGEFDLQGKLKHCNQQEDRYILLQRR